MWTRHPARGVQWRSTEPHLQVTKDRTAVARHFCCSPIPDFFALLTWVGWFTWTFFSLSIAAFVFSAQPASYGSESDSDRGRHRSGVVAGAHGAQRGRDALHHPVRLPEGVASRTLADHSEGGWVARQHRNTFFFFVFLISDPAPCRLNVTTGTHTMALLEKLEPGNVYLVKISSSNQVGDSPFSDTVELVPQRGSSHRHKNPRHSDTILDTKGKVTTRTQRF